MSPSGRSEQMGALRDVIARIEGGDAFAPVFDRTDTPRKVALGRAGNVLAIDRLLRGGLLRGTLNEVVAVSAGDAGAACGFALALAARFVAEKGRLAAPVVWVMEDAARAEGGAPYAPGLAAHGLDPARLLVVRAKRRHRRVVGRRGGPEMPRRGGRRGRPVAHQDLRPRRLASPAARRGYGRHARDPGAGRRAGCPTVLGRPGPVHRGRGARAARCDRCPPDPRPRRLGGTPRPHPRRSRRRPCRLRLGKDLAARLGPPRGMFV